MTAIKICGLTRQQDIQTANQLGLDYIGFVFAPSRRQVTFDQAKALKAALSPTIKAVGVFVNAPLETMSKAMDDQIIDLIQLHGGEPEETIQALKSKYPAVPIIKALRVTGPEDILQWQSSQADYLLLDNGAGGTGQTFDWNLLPQTGLKKPYFLAGGLSPQNAAQALAYAPYALDVSSGVETDGLKDMEKMKKFVHEVRP